MSALVYLLPFAIPVAVFLFIRRSGQTGGPPPVVSFAVSVWLGPTAILNTIDGPGEGIPRGASAPIYWLIVIALAAASVATARAGLRRSRGR